MAAEVIAWPEGRIYFYSANAVTPAAISYAERVSLTFQATYKRYRNLTTGAWDQRVAYVHSDQRVQVQVGQFWSESDFLLRARSATAWNVAFSADRAVGTAAWMIWSGVILQALAIGQGGGLFRYTMQLEAVNFSAL